MKFYFAGTEPEPYRKLMEKCNVKNVLNSYYTLGDKGKIPKGIESFILDSGGYAARTRGVKISVKDYATYINKHGVRLAFNLDTNDNDETQKNQRFLDKACPDCYIIPIYHQSDYLFGDRELLNKFLDKGYEYISTGGTAGVRVKPKTTQQFMDYVFTRTKDKIKVHGLGISNRKMLYRYPYYSSDSTSWLSPARYGQSLEKNSDITRVRREKYHHLHRTEIEIYHYLDMEKDVTKVWQRRGIQWQK